MSNIRCGSCAKLYTCLITDALLCLNNNNMLYKNKNFIELEEELPKYVISYGDFYYIKREYGKDTFTLYKEYATTYCNSDSANNVAEELNKRLSHTCYVQELND